MKNHFNAVIRHLYQKSKSAQQDKLEKIFFTKPHFYKPSADSNLLVKWDEIFSLSKTNNSLPEDICKALTSIVKKKVHIVPAFDFAKIDSLSASKGFGQDWIPTINGSWFGCVASWGQGMFPGRELSGLDDNDFKNNINHIENYEGFIKGRDIKINHYSWLNRYVGSQSGGSHHAAMLIHQLRHQNRTYTRQANVSLYELKIDYIKDISSKYFMFVTNDNAYSAEINSLEAKTKQIVSEFISNDGHYINVASCCLEPVIICFIPKKSLLVDEGIFERWYGEQLSRGVIIDLISLLENTTKYCNTPYHHELTSIYLGDPFRENDLEIRKLGN